MTATFAVGAATVDSRGAWRVVVRHPFFFFPETAAEFTVLDPANATADLAVTPSFLSESVQAGGQVTFGLQVNNYGPNSSANITLANAVPANTTFVSFQQLSGPTFTCNSPSTGSTGTTACTITGLASNARATFVGVYEVNAGVAAGTNISNLASIDSGTNDLNQLNNSSDASTTVVSGVGGGCTLTCPANVVVTADTTSGGQSGAFVTFAAAGVSGDCGAVTNSPASGSFFPVGTHTIVSTSEVGGASCIFTVTVLDSAPPTITCPADVTVTAPVDSEEANVDPGTPTFTASGGGTVTGIRSDNIPADPKALTDPYPVGITGILWTVTDADGRTASCKQRINVVANSCGEDPTPPTITAPDDVTVATGPGNTGCSVALDDELGQADAIDNCSVTVSITGMPAGNAFPIGTTTLTYVATDGAGNTATDTQVVTVIDNTPPVIKAPANASYVCRSEVPAASPSQATRGDVFDENGNLLPPSPPFDNCGTPVVTVTETQTGAGSAASPLIITRTFTATDAANNSTSDVQTITVIDSVAPTITGPADVTAYTGAGATSCESVISNAALGTPAAQDNCAVVTVTRSPSGNTFPLGTTDVIWTATDASGNTATATQRVTVIDNTPPVVTPPANIVVFLPLNSTDTSMVVNYPNPATATDNCPGTLNISYSVASGSIFPVGTTPVSASTTDAHGNVGSATFTVTVLYNFTGFFSPVDNLPTLNVLAAGRGVPVKFSLSGDKGLNIFAPDSPFSISINCDSSLPQNDIEETLNAGGSSLSYDPASDQYIYVWKTQNPWKNTCRQLLVVLNDGSEHRANFKFK